MLTLEIKAERNRWIERETWWGLSRGLRWAMAADYAEYQWYLKYKSNDVSKLPPWEPPINGPRNPYGTKYVAQRVQFVVSVANNEWLAREARRLGISKSEFLNRLIEEQRL